MAQTARKLWAYRDVSRIYCVLAPRIPQFCKGHVDIFGGAYTHAQTRVSPTPT